MALEFFTIFASPGDPDKPFASVAKAFNACDIGVHDGEFVAQFRNTKQGRKNGREFVKQLQTCWRSTFPKTYVDPNWILSAE